MTYPYRLAFILILYGLTGCVGDSPQKPPQSGGYYETDEYVIAPVVPCEDAFALYDSPMKGRLAALSFNPAGTGMGIARSGKIFVVTEDGEQWWELPNNLPKRSSELLSFVSDSTFYFVTSNRRTLYRSDDLGQTIQEIPSPDATRITALRFEDAQTGYLLLYRGTDVRTYYFFQTNDGGLTWSDVDLPVSPTQGYFLEVEERTALHTAHHLIIRGKPDGDWGVRPLPDGHHATLAFDGRNRGLLAADDHLYRTNDGGRNWTAGEQMINGVDHLSIGPDGRGSLTGKRYGVVGGDGLLRLGLLIHHTTDGGETWSALKTDGECGTGRTFHPTPSGRLLSIADQLVMTE